MAMANELTCSFWLAELFKRYFVSRIAI